uniref:Eukaryotic translation initiation factor 3 subunit G N-terminal domain-containing protein n=1 Tax=Aegilops tauschii subsp. strangulata TaxID=200361 RepID=A0A453HBU4_AEGTS
PTAREFATKPPHPRTLNPGEAATAAMAAAKIRWGELDEEDDGGDLDFLLPPPVVVGPDANGLKKTIHYRFDDDGNKVKVTTTTRVVKLARTRLSKAAVERRSWAKFGDAASGDDASARLTVVSTEEIFLERPRAPGSSILSLSPPPRSSLHLCRIICCLSPKVLDSRVLKQRCCAGC